MASRSPKVVREAAASCADANTTFVQADPATFRALVQKLTGAAPEETIKHPQQEVVSTVAPPPPAPVPRRPKLQERRRAAPSRLELARPHHPSFYYYHHHHAGLIAAHSPVSPMDAYVLAASTSSSPSSSMSPSPRGVVISKEEEEREEKAIASKAFYLHSSPRSAGVDGERPKLLPLFPVHSPRRSFFAS